MAPWTRVVGEGRRRRLGGRRERTRIRQEVEDGHALGKHTHGRVLDVSLVLNLYSYFNREEGRMRWLAVVLSVNTSLTWMSSLTFCVSLLRTGMQTCSSFSMYGWGGEGG